MKQYVIWIFKMKLTVKNFGILLLFFCGTMHNNNICLSNLNVVLLFINKFFQINQDILSSWLICQIIKVYYLFFQEIKCSKRKILQNVLSFELWSVWANYFWQNY